MNYPVKCFLIDDDEDDQEIFSMALQDLNFSIQLVCAISSKKALLKLSIEKDYIPDCIFIDLNMPVLNGRECLEEIKKIERLQKVPVFLYSTSADPKVVQEVKAQGAADFIEKPSNISNLTERLRIILDDSQPIPFPANE